MGQIAQTRLPCPVCPSHDAFVEYEPHHDDTHDAYCFSCKYSRPIGDLPKISRVEVAEDSVPYKGLPVDYEVNHMPAIYREWLHTYDLYDACVNLCGWSESLQRVVFPIYWEGQVKAYQARSLDKQPKWIGNSSTQPWGKKFPYIVCVTGSRKRQDLVIVEDILSAIKIGKYFNVVALLGTSIHPKLRDFLSVRFKNTHIWLDNDTAGIESATKIKYVFGMSNKTRIITSERDPKFYSYARILEICDGLQIATTATL